MTQIQEKQDIRRLAILEGLTDGLSNAKIAEKLGVHQRLVRRDLARMKYSQDLELKQVQTDAKEKALAAKEKISNRSGERLMRLTGMTFQEKSFNNMISFYEPEIRKIMKAKNTDVAIRNLPSNVAKTLKRNGIIISGWKNPQVSQRARTCLATLKGLRN